MAIPPQGTESLKRCPGGGYSVAFGELGEEAQSGRGGQFDAVAERGEHGERTWSLEWALTPISVTLSRSRPFSELPSL